MDAQALLESYGPLALGALALVEGPMVTVLGGALARLGLVHPVTAFAALVAGDVLGDLVFYMLGRQGSRRLPLWLTRAFGLTRKRLLTALKMLRAQGVRLVIWGKLTHAAGFAVLLAAGAARMPLKQFLAANFAASLLKAAALMTLGWLGGTALTLGDIDGF